MSIYSDMKPTLGLSNGSVEVITDIDVIVQSVKTIISTVSGERVRNPLGSRIIRLLFQPMTPDLALQLKNEIATVILKYEPRVTIATFSLTPNYDGNYYDIYIVLTIVGISNPALIRTKVRSFSENF